MSIYPKTIQDLINVFSHLPGIGPKTAERLVFYLLDNHINELSTALTGINGQIKLCSKCLNYSDQEYCQICSEPKRDQQTIAVVAKPQDIAALERSHEYNGVYHILGGLLSPLEGITASELNIKQLQLRLKGVNNVNEIILAFDNNVEGETTALYLTKLLKNPAIKITRLARGLPMGSDLEYADEITLRDAIKNRQSL